MFKLDSYLVTNPKGESEYLDGASYLKRMVKMATIVRDDPTAFLSWAKSKGIPLPISHSNADEVPMTTFVVSHLKAYLIDNGFKFEEL